MTWNILSRLWHRRPAPAEVQARAEVALLARCAMQQLGWMPYRAHRLAFIAWRYRRGRLTEFPDRRVGDGREGAI